MGPSATYVAQNSMTRIFASRQPALFPRSHTNEASSSIHSRSTLFPWSGLTQPGLRKGGGPFLSCASKASHDGKKPFARSRSITAWSWRALKSAGSTVSLGYVGAHPRMTLTDSCIPLS